MQHVHFIGIGGTGLSAIAMVLLERGFKVSGSDRQISPLTRRLQETGAHVSLIHSPENIIGADLVIRSSAIPDENPEVQAALKAGLPVLKRIDFLDQLIGEQQAIAVAGAHGKTTTTAMIAWMLISLGYDPSYVFGGDSKDLGGNAHAGEGDYFVIEADEYDRMFHGISPYLAIITNVEHDHPDCYPTEEEFFQAFLEFVDRIEPGGVLLVCGDDPGVKRLLNSVLREDIRILSYGIEVGVDFCASNPIPNQVGGFSFVMVFRDGRKDVNVNLQVPGIHNLYNALAALSVASLVDISLSEAASSLHIFRGTGRRFDVVGEVNGITLIDDYAHHPTEIKATLAAARILYAERRIWAVWQPHTYSRMRSLFEEFLGAFSDADHLIITDVYAARESFPEDGFSADLLVSALSTISTEKPTKKKYLPELEQTRDYLMENLLPGDVLIVLSAGDAQWINVEILKFFQARKTSILKDNAQKPVF